MVTALWVVALIVVYFLGVFQSQEAGRDSKNDARITGAIGCVGFVLFAVVWAVLFIIYMARG